MPRLFKKMHAELLGNGMGSRGTPDYESTYIVFETVDRKMVSVIYIEGQ